MIKGLFFSEQNWRTLAKDFGSILAGVLKSRFRLFSREDGSELDENLLVHVIGAVSLLMTEPTETQNRNGIICFKDAEWRQWCINLAIAVARDLPVDFIIHPRAEPDAGMVESAEIERLDDWIMGLVFQAKSEYEAKFTERS